MTIDDIGARLSRRVVFLDVPVQHDFKIIDLVYQVWQGFPAIGVWLDCIGHLVDISLDRLHNAVFNQHAQKGQDGD